MNNFPCSNVAPVCTLLARLDVYATAPTASQSRLERKQPPSQDEGSGDGLPPLMSMAGSAAHCPGYAGEQMAAGEAQLINELREARRRLSRRMMRKAIEALHESLTDEQIAGELGTTPEKVQAFRLGHDTSMTHLLVV
jgi:hypothetical protein